MQREKTYGVVCEDVIEDSFIDCQCAQGFDRRLRIGAMWYLRRPFPDGAQSVNELFKVSHQISHQQHDAQECRKFKMLTGELGLDILNTGAHTRSRTLRS